MLEQLATSRELYLTILMGARRPIGPPERTGPLQRLFDEKLLLAEDLPDFATLVNSQDILGRLSGMPTPHVMSEFEYACSHEVDIVPLPYGGDSQCL
jgi:hypothetical protein